MAAPLTSRAPTCLSCLRRSLGPSAPALATATLPIPSTPTQIRGKKTMTDHGVVVRLLRDVKGFGKAESIFFTERGRMRNLWFPRKTAEYMTPERFAELGLTRDAIGERDAQFGAGSKEVKKEKAKSWEASFDDVIESFTPKAVESIAPERATDLLQTMLPDTLVFTRASKTSQPQAAPQVTPLTSEGATPAADAETIPKTADSSAAIFGSVTTADVAGMIRELLVSDAEGSRVAVEARDISFLGLEEGEDRVRSLGRFTVQISVGGRGADGAVSPVFKTVEVIAG